MGTLSPTHSAFLCIATSSLAGVGSGFFGCLLSYADKLKTENGKKNTKLSKRLAVTGMLGSTIFGCGSLVALYFGSMALVTVIRAGTLLPANAIFAHVFGLRPLVREDYLGTVVAISGVVCFTIFTGTPGQDLSTGAYVRSLTSGAACAGNAVLLALFLASLSWVCWGQHRAHLRHKGNARLALAAAVAGIGGCSSAFMDLAVKGWTASIHAGGINGALSSPLFWVAFLINVLFLVGMRASMIYGCKRCDVLLFVPLNTVFNILMSVGAGLLVLQEWRHVTSWMGLIAASFSILGGIAMLVCGPADGQAPNGTTTESSNEASRPPRLERKATMLQETGAALYNTAIGGCHTKSVALSRLNQVHEQAADTRARFRKAVEELCIARTRTALVEAMEAGDLQMPQGADGRASEAGHQVSL